MKYRILILSALAALIGTQVSAQTARISSVAIAPATGVVTVTERIGTPTNVPTSVSDNLAGLAYAFNNVPLTGDLANSPVADALFAITGRVISGGALVDDFKGYGTKISPNTSVATYLDVRNKFTAQAAFYAGGSNSYSGLVWLPVGDTFSLPGPNVFYTIHHRPSGDYFSVIVPGTSNTSDAYDLKPMSAAGVVTDPSKPGYFGLAYAAVSPGAGYNANSMYYLRTAQAVDSYPAGNIIFGEMIPALTSGPADKFNLNTAVGSFGVAGYKALVFSPDNLGEGVSQFYYLRQDSTGTGNTILGRLNPSTTPGVRTISDIANLGGVFDTLALARAATGPADAWATSPTLFASGAALAVGAQSVSFAAIADKNVGALNQFVVHPSASSTAALTLTVVAGSTGTVTIAAGPGVGDFTVTPTGTGVVTLEAKQSGSGFATNWLRQSFNILGPPVITTQPASQTAVATSAATFSVIAVGTAPLTYQWSKGGAAIGGATNATLTFASVAAGDAGSYTVVVTGGVAPAATSSAAILTVTAAIAPSITTQPLPQTTAVGGSTTFSVVATGSPAPTYQWRKSAGNIAGATNASYAIANTALLDAGNYDVVVTNSAGSVTANTVTLTVTAPVAPTITTQPLPKSVALGAGATFTVVANGAPTPTYQWRKNGGNIAGANAASYTLAGTVSGDAGNYDVVVTNSAGSVTSTSVALTVAPAVPAVPIITSSTVAAGTVAVPFSYTIIASGQPTSFTATELPAGLSLDAATGAITGTPTKEGVTVVIIGALNSVGGNSTSVAITIAQNARAPIITSATTAPGNVGEAFTPYVIIATGSPTGYSATDLPTGLRINTVTGLITGTPTTPGISVVQLGATNAFGTDTATLTITVVPAIVAPIITSATTAQGTVGKPFATYVFAPTGSPTSYTAVGLPPGLSLNSPNGAITGTPTTAGVSIVALSAANSAGTGTATLTITIVPAGVAPVITSPTTAPGTVGKPFVTYLIAAAGLPTSFSATGLPTGLTVNALTGAINGTPTSPGISIVTLGATNSSGTGNATLTITVAQATTAPIITSPMSAPGTVGKPFVTYQIAATGFPTSYAATGLPAGLTVNVLTGAINGTPTAAGLSFVTLTATNGSGSGAAVLSITVAPASIPPVITSPTIAPATVGAPFVTYLIAATGLPTSYTAAGLPPGLTLNALTGAINGTPTAAGTYVVTLNATNSTGTGSATLIITVAPAGVAPIITSQTNAPATVGKPFVTYLIAATGLPTSYTATGLPPGLTLNALTGAINGTPTTTGTYVVTLSATNTTGTGTATLTISVAAAGTVPAITNGTLIATGTLGTPFNYAIAASGSPTSYTAFNLPPGLVLNPLTGVISGTPTAANTTFVTLTAVNANGNGTATLMIVTAAAPVPSSRIVNFSARAVSGPGDQSLIMGFVVVGDGKNLLVRGIGPALTSYGVTNALADPLLTLYNPNAAVATNDNWQIDSNGQNQGVAIAAIAARVGAFALPDGSKDSSLLFTVNNGAHTTGLLRPNSTTGVALTEIYDIDDNIGARLVNVSARMNVTAGEGTLIAGLVIKGNAPKTVLIRGVGPTLTAFGVAGVLADPTIAIFSGSTQMAGNDNWETGTSTAAQLISTSARVGAFALQAGSKDAALVVTLQPGNYTVQVTGVGNTAGVALVEVYDTQ